ncbi:MAG: HAD hydrolase family protein [Clostridiales bacterium]
MSNQEVTHKIYQYKKHLPLIGMRIFKSAIAVFICLSLNILRGSNGLPFYSAIATILCMQPYVGNSLKVALNRVWGTIIGAIFGCVILLIEINLIPHTPIIIHYLVVSFTVIPIIYTTVVLGKKEASYIACVAFLSVTVTTMIGTSPFFFAAERVVDTIIGISVALVVNACHIPRRKNKNILFISALDETLVTPNNTLTDYSKVVLNQMIQDGVNFTVSTARTPASLMVPLTSVNLKLPVIAANGALLFDLTTKTYVKKWELPYETAKTVADYLESRDIHAFITAVIDDVLIIYYENFDNPAEALLYEEMRYSPYRNYISHPLPQGRNVIYLMTLNKDEAIASLKADLEKQPFAKDIYIYCQPSEYQGYSYLKIYDKDVSRRKMMRWLQKDIEAEKIITFGSIEGQYDIVVQDNDTNTMVKTLKNLYEPFIWKKP